MAMDGGSLWPGMDGSLSSGRGGSLWAGRIGNAENYRTAINTVKRFSKRKDLHNLTFKLPEPYRVY